MTSFDEQRAATAGWKPYRFAEMLVDEAISYGIVQPGAHTEVNSVPIVRVNNIREGRIHTDEVLKVAAEVEGQYVRTRLKGGELLITVVGTVGQCAIVPAALEGWNVARAISVARLKPEFDARFVKYCFKLEDVIFQMYGNTNDTVQPTLNLGQLKSLVLNAPSLREQRNIADTLGGLDDKIDLLRRQNQTLEAMAETLFRQWFVEEADESWETCTIGEVLSVRGGTTPSTKDPDLWGGDVAWTSPRDLAQQRSIHLFDTSRKITRRGLAQIGSGLLPAGTVLLSSRAPIGYLAIADVPMAINQGYIAMVCDDGIPNYFAYLWCKHSMDDIKAAGNGSTFEEISKSSFKALPFRMPAVDKLEAFDPIATELFAKLRSNELQVRQLEHLRDTLLPKLISGEVRVAC